MRPQEYAKAFAGGILAGLGVLYVALTDDFVSSQEWVAIVVAALTTFTSVWGVPNAPKQGTVAQQKVTVETTQVDPGPKHIADPLTGL